MKKPEQTLFKALIDMGYVAAELSMTLKSEIGASATVKVDSNTKGSLYTQINPIARLYLEGTVAYEPAIYGIPIKAIQVEGNVDLDMINLNQSSINFIWDNVNQKNYAWTLPEQLSYPEKFPSMHSSIYGGENGR